MLIFLINVTAQKGERRNACDLYVYQLICSQWRHLLKFLVCNLKERSIVHALHSQSTGSYAVELAPT